MVGEMKGQVFQPSQSKLGGMDARYAVLIAYLAGGILSLISGVQFVAWLIPLIVYLVDKENKFIAFHAMQALLLQIVALIIYIICSIIAAVSVVGAITSAAMLNGIGIGAGVGAVAVAGIIMFLVGVAVLIFSIIAAVKGYQYEIYEIPLVGGWAERIVFKTAK